VSYCLRFRLTFLLSMEILSPFTILHCLQLTVALNSSFAGVSILAQAAAQSFLLPALDSSIQPLMTAMITLLFRALTHLSSSGSSLLSGAAKSSAKLFAQWTVLACLKKIKIGRTRDVRSHCSFQTHSTALVTYFSRRS
jgi:hypothetical protein